MFTVDLLSEVLRNGEVRVALCVCRREAVHRNEMEGREIDGQALSLSRLVCLLFVVVNKTFSQVKL